MIYQIGTMVVVSTDSGKSEGEVTDRAYRRVARTGKVEERYRVRYQCSSESGDQRGWFGLDEVSPTIRR
jgi:hypothetical protein